MESECTCIFFCWTHLLLDEKEYSLYPIYLFIYKAELHAVLCLNHVWGYVMSWVAICVEEKSGVFIEVFCMVIWFSSNVRNSI
jgi:hypothetical protein